MGLQGVLIDWMWLPVMWAFFLFLIRLFYVKKKIPSSLPFSLSHSLPPCIHPSTHPKEHLVGWVNVNLIVQPEDKNPNFLQDDCWREGKEENLDTLEFRNPGKLFRVGKTLIYRVIKLQSGLMLAIRHYFSFIKFFMFYYTWMLNFQVQEKAGNPGMQIQSGNSMLNSSGNIVNFNSYLTRGFVVPEKKQGTHFIETPQSGHSCK